jgi:hypothetical protein
MGSEMGSGLVLMHCVPINFQLAIQEAFFSTTAPPEAPLDQSPVSEQSASIAEFEFLRSLI